MEIRDIQVVKKNNARIECEICVGNVSKNALSEARDATGYNRPKIYLNGIYDKTTGKFTPNEIKEGQILYTRSSGGDIIPLSHAVRARSIVDITIFVRHNMESRKV